MPVAVLAAGLDECSRGAITFNEKEKMRIKHEAEDEEEEEPNLVGHCRTH